MKTEFSFNIESLLYGIENPKGPIEQVLFATKMAEHQGMRSFNRLALLTFTDLTINKALPGAIPLDETLLHGYEGRNDTVLHLCIRSGRSALNIATGYFPKRKISIHEEYRHAIILRKLSDTEINRIFSYVWNNLGLIQPKRR
ncbi:MAG: hypothetical protein QHC79_25540 [Pseudosphingobacterium sp.]|nr:hypothetical protein [Pseudosphingobacterium sp.]